jgi:hypothetical protein
VLIVGSPRGFNWLATAFGLETDHPPHAYTRGYSPKEGYFVRACRTDDNRDHLGSNYAKSLEEAYGERYAAQELNASLLSAQGRIFPDFYRSVHVIPHKTMTHYWNLQVRRRCGGVDWGWTNPASVVVCGKTADDEMLIPDMWYSSQKMEEEQGYHMWRLGKQWDCHEWKADPSSPGSIEKLRRGFAWGDGERISLNVSAGNNQWLSTVNLLRSLMQVRRGLKHPAHGLDNDFGRPRLLLSDRCEPLVNEMLQYQELELKEGQAPREGARGDDHAIDCARYAASALFETFQPQGAQIDF